MATCWQFLGNSRSFETLREVLEGVPPLTQPGDVVLLCLYLGNRTLQKKLTDRIAELHR